MAVEADDQGYCFAPQWNIGLAKDRYIAQAVKNTDKFKYDIAFRAPNRARTCTAASWDMEEGVVKEGWCYNPLHDMESIAWLFARALLYRDHYFQRVDGLPVTPFVIGNGENTVDPFAEEDPEERIQRIKAYYTFGRALFVTRTARYKTMYQSQYLGAYLRAHPLFPGVVPLRAILINMRNKLVEQYKNVESDVTAIDHTCAEELTLDFMQELGTGYEYLTDVADNGYEIQTRSLQSEFELFCQQDKSIFPAGTKRSRDEEDDDDEDDSVSRPPKSPRTDTNSSPRKSPAVVPSLNPATPPAVVATTIPADPKYAQSDSPPANPDTRPKRHTAGVPPATRTLRSHARKIATLKTASPSPKLPSPARPARSRKPASRKGKATKNDEAVRAAAKVAAKVKSKTRKGR